MVCSTAQVSCPIFNTYGSSCFAYMDELFCGKQFLHNFNNFTFCVPTSKIIFSFFLQVNDENVEDMSTAEIIDLLRKIRGTIGIRVLRKSGPNLQKS